MSKHRPNKVHSLCNHSSPLAEKITEEPVTQKAASSNVTCLYQVNIANYYRNVTILWTKQLMNHTMSIMVDGINGGHSSCKVDVKPRHFWSRKGYRSFEIDGNEVNVYWDLRSAKFSGSPEPSSDYYIALVSEDEVVLLLGDNKKKAYKRTKCRPALVEAVLYQKKEHVFAKKSFSTRAKIDESQKDHDIVVESSITGPRDPEMWISIDGIVLIHIRNLQWKFRGNQTVTVNQQSVQVFWDVHDWLFNSSGTSSGLFIFKPGGIPDYDSDNGSSNSSGGSKYFSTQSCTTSPDFSLFLYAWKIEQTHPYKLLM